MIRPVAIRPMTARDIPALVGWMLEVPLWQRYGLTASGATRAFEEALRRDDLALVADLPDRPAGGFAWCMPRAAFARSAYLRLIGVHPEGAGQGVGAGLLERIESAARETSQEMLLLVSDFNGAAQRFYERHGYARAGALPGYVLPDVSELIYLKRLREGGAGQDLLAAE